MSHLDEAFDLGEAAGLAWGSGDPIDDNPYPLGSEEYNFWSLGFSGGCMVAMRNPPNE